MRGTSPNSLANLRPGGRPGPGTPKMNLIRDDFELVAEKIIQRQRARRETIHVYVLPTGAVYVVPKHKARADDWNLVGTYNGDARCEHVEDDLLAWLRERSGVVG